MHGSYCDRITLPTIQFLEPNEWIPSVSESRMPSMMENQSSQKEKNGFSKKGLGKGKMDPDGRLESPLFSGVGF